MMNGKRMGRELREKGNSVGKIGTCTGDQIHERSDHLLVQVLVVYGFGWVGFDKLTFRVNRCLNRSSIRKTEPFQDFANVLFLRESNSSLCLLNFDS